MMASSGLTTRFWISCGEAPGLATMMLAAGTTICGLYSRGVTNSAMMPASATASMIMAVILDSMKTPASLPAILSGAERSVMGSSAHLVAVHQLADVGNDHLVAGVQAGLDFHHALLGRAGAHHAIAREALGVNHEHAGDAGALGQCCKGYADPLAAADGKPHAYEISARQAAACGQIDLHQMRVAGRIGCRHHLGDHAFDRRLRCIAIGHDA